MRGYTLVDPDPGAGTVSIDFAMHDGLATRWAQEAEPGEVLEVTVLGSNFSLPEPAPSGYVIVGDTASLPAINSLLDAIGDAPARVFLEAAHDDDRDLPIARNTDVVWVDRKTTARHSSRRCVCRPSTRPTTSAGSPATTAPHARCRRSSARSTRSRASR